jgi:RNA polymerase sigma-70 factor (ECF subfamily)
MDQDLLRELYEKYGPHVYRRCLWLLRNEADARDAMHDVFIKAGKNLEAFRGESSPLTWVTRIATNHCLNVLRGRRAAWHDQYRRDAEHRAQEGEEPQRLVDKKQFVHRVMSLCSDQEQEAAVYYFVDEMTQEEAARAVGISVPTLRKRLRSFMEVARRELREIDPDLRLGEPPV